MLTLRSGIDLVDIGRLTDLNPAIRRRFIKRVFTSQEIEDCKDLDASLAARFAVKEAVSKALGCGIGEVSWQEIEVQRGPSGEPQLKLHGNAAKIAAQQLLQGWSISISHTRTQATAIAIAIQTIESSDDNSIPLTTHS